MSKYKGNIQSEKEERLKELVSSAKRTLDEIAPLETYLNAIKGQISELMDELDLSEGEGVKRVVDTDTLIDFEKLSQHKEVFKYVVGNVDETTTLSLMYKDHIDYTVSKRLLEKAINNSSIRMTHNERIEI